MALAFPNLLVRLSLSTQLSFFGFIFVFIFLDSEAICVPLVIIGRPLVYFEQ